MEISSGLSICTLCIPLRNRTAGAFLLRTSEVQLIIKDRLGANYAEFSGLLLCMTDDELKAFEKNREDFYKIF